MTAALPRGRRRRTVGRVLLGSALVVAGTAHLTSQRQEFQAQVPSWVPLPADDVVVMSGVVEVCLGGGLVLLPKEQRRLGAAAALFFTAIFPGNVAQLVERKDGFGLDTDAKRAVRLLGQPLLVALSLWSTRSPRGEVT